MESRVEKAARVAEGDAKLRKHFEEQKTWDAHIAEVIHSIAPPDDLRRKLVNFAPSRGERRRPLRSQLIQPAMLAVVIGVLVLIGWIVFNTLQQRENFRGRERVERLLSVTKRMSGAELKPVDAKTWQLGDWFYMRGFEQFAVPPEIASLPAVGSRVFRSNGHTVAQVAVDERNCLVYVFRAADFDVDLPDGGDWRLLNDEGWVAAIRRQGQICTMVAFVGTRSEMRAFLKSLKSK